jgi:hypothetical protein
MRSDMLIPLNTTFDKEYGRWDIAPRVMGQRDCDGEVGWPLAYDPISKKYLLAWEDEGGGWYTAKDFVVIAGVVA